MRFPVPLILLPFVYRSFPYLRIVLTFGFGQLKIVVTYHRYGFGRMWKHPFFWFCGSPTAGITQSQRENSVQPKAEGSINSLHFRGSLINAGCRLLNRVANCDPPTEIPRAAASHRTPVDSRQSLTWKLKWRTICQMKQYRAVSSDPDVARQVGC